MTNRTLCLAVAFTATLLVGWLPGTSSGARGHSSPVGAWFATSTITTPALPIPLQRLITVHADGTFLSSDVDDFGSIGMDIQSDLNSPIQGAWVKSGRRSFAFTGLCFVFDRTSGDPIATGKVTANVAFPHQRRGKHAPQVSDDVLEGSFSAVRFRLDQDPLDPSAKPVEGSFKEGVISLQRIRARPRVRGQR